MNGKSLGTRGASAFSAKAPGGRDGGRRGGEGRGGEGGGEGRGGGEEGEEGRSVIT